MKSAISKFSSQINTQRPALPVGAAHPPGEFSTLGVESVDFKMEMLSNPYTPVNTTGN